MVCIFFCFLLWKREEVVSEYFFLFGSFNIIEVWTGRGIDRKFRVLRRGVCLFRF